MAPHSRQRTHLLGTALIAVIVPISATARAQTGGPRSQDALASRTPVDTELTATTARAIGSTLYARYPWLPRLLGAQFTYIWQDLPPFHALYSGKNSLSPGGDNEGTHTYGVYVGARLSDIVQLYADGEMARGAGISHATGLAGITNGDVIRQGSANLGQGPYLARAYARFIIPLTTRRDQAERGEDQLPGSEPTTRVEIKAGKFALSDDIDLNRYAGSTRYQFMDWGLWQNTAWDFAADTRGYTNGAMVGIESPRWTLRLAAAQMPTVANGNTFDGDIPHAHAFNAELTMRPLGNGTVVRILAFDNRARMGIYRKALDLARRRDTTPCIACDDRRDRAKYGFGLNVERPLADSGNIGVFLRLGWNDGRTEDFAFTETDRVASGGVQVGGNAWHRSDDRFGVAAVVAGLSKDHEAYLAAGGLGFLLGDGKLTRYGTENIVEGYYRFQPPRFAFLQITPAIQHIDHPGYNVDRGPVYVYTVRVNLHY